MWEWIKKLFRRDAQTPETPTDATAVAQIMTRRSARLVYGRRQGLAMPRMDTIKTRNAR